MSTTYRLTDLALPYLLDGTGISFCAKGLYILICHVQPESIAHLALVSGVSGPVVKRECKALKEEGWLSFDITKSQRTIITPTAPDGVQQELVKWLDGVRATWFPAGENIMRSMLDNTVAVSDASITADRLTSLIRHRDTASNSIVSTIARAWLSSSRAFSIARVRLFTRAMKNSKTHRLEIW